MNVLVTGAGGFLGRGLIVPFEGVHTLRLMDVAEFEDPNHECLIGSVADLETCRKAVKGMDAIVIAHMASRQVGSYETPEVPFDVNVKGTANLFFAAAEQGIRRVVLVSSTGVVGHHQQVTKRFLDRGLPMMSHGIYGLTKICQETIAEQYHRTEGFQVACLRLGYIVDGDLGQDKYGKPFNERNWQLSDRRDIGGAALAAVELPDLEWEIFYVMSTDESMAHCDTRYTRARLGWMPTYKFKHLPPAQATKDVFGEDYS
jgi:nucleoside-diphosphate-sugar epimerase